MIFIHNILTPHNTPSDTPLITPIDIIIGTITLVGVQFPPGVNALAHLKLLYGLYQLFPSNEQGDFSTGGETITWDEQIDITAEPLTLTAITWNDDTEYDHTISVRIVMQPAAGGQSVNSVVAAIQAQQVQSQTG